MYADHIHFRVVAYVKHVNFMDLWMISNDDKMSYFRIYSTDTYCIYILIKERNSYLTFPPMK